MIDLSFICGLLCCQKSARVGRVFYTCGQRLNRLTVGFAGSQRRILDNLMNFISFGHMMDLQGFDLPRFFGRCCFAVFGLFAATGWALAQYTVSYQPESDSFAPTQISSFRGFSFTLDEQGDGTGSLEGHPQARLDSITFFHESGVPTGLTSARTLSIYDFRPDPPEGTAPSGFLFQNTGVTVTGTDVTHTFDGTGSVLDVGTQYFALLDDFSLASVSKMNDPYPGGRALYLSGSEWNDVPGAQETDAFFEVVTTPVPEPAHFALVLGLGILLMVGRSRRWRG